MIVPSLIFLPMKIINVHFADIFQNSIKNINACYFSNIKLSCVIFSKTTKNYQCDIFQITYQYVMFFKIT